MCWLTGAWLIKHSYYFKPISKLFSYGGPLTSVRMAHLLFNVLQPVPNLLYFWLMVGDQGIEPRIRAPDAKRRIAVLAFGQSRAYKRVMPFHQSPICGVEAAYIPGAPTSGRHYTIRFQS